VWVCYPKHNLYCVWTLGWNDYDVKCKLVYRSNFMVVSLQLDVSHRNESSRGQFWKKLRFFKDCNAKRGRRNFQLLFHCTVGCMHLSTAGVTFSFKECNYCHFLDTLHNCKKWLLASSCLSVCPSTWNNLITTEQIFIQFDVKVVF
jgi:hypothetical protein